MEQLFIETTQNVDIEHDIASVGERVVAHSLDYMFFLAYSAIIFFLFVAIGMEEAWWIIILFWAIPLFFYDLFCELLFSGQSFGKLVMRIKVVKIDGSQVSFGNCIMRWILRLVDNVMFLGTVSIVAILVNGRGQRLGDLAAGTTVVRKPPKASLEKTIHVELPDNYEIRFEQVKLLSDKDIWTIREVIERLRKNPDEHDIIILGYKTKSVVEKKMGIKTEIKPLPFLEFVLKDYNWHHRKQLPARN